MSSQPEPAPTIPARLTPAELAAATGRPIEEVKAALEARSEASGPDEMIGPELSTAVAMALGVKVNIEPRDVALEALYELETRGAHELEGLTGRAARLVAGVLERARTNSRASPGGPHDWWPGCWRTVRTWTTRSNRLRIIGASPECPSSTDRS